MNTTSTDHRPRNRWKLLGILAIPFLTGCHPFGLRFRDSAQSSISVEPLGPPAISEEPDSGRAGTKPHPTLAAARDAKRRMDRLSGTTQRKNGSNESNEGPSILDSATPDEDIEQSLAGIPPALQSILSNQMLAVKKYSADQPTVDGLTSRLPASDPDSVAEVKLGRPLARQASHERDDRDELIAQTDKVNVKKRHLGGAHASLSDRDDVDVSNANDVRSASSTVDSHDDGQVAQAVAKKTNSIPKSANHERTSAEEDTKAESTETAVELGAWKKNLATSIVQLQQQLKTAPETDENIKLQQESTLRLLQLANGKLSESLTPIPDLTEHEQEYFRHQFQAIYEATQPSAIPIKARRWGVVMNSQRQATDHLSAVSNMEIKSAAICTAVDGYGVITKFSKYQFRPDQDVLLYCELDNISADAVQDGFETQLQGNYEIVDRNGARVADQMLQVEREVCKNRRRDYFIVYRIYMPMQIAPGSYQLRLTIEDMKAHKFGQSTIDFQIVK